MAFVSDGVQPGTEVDEELWSRFREEVKRRKGGVRGHLRTELENALRGYIHGGDATPAEIDARLQRIEAAVGAAGTDGGTDTFEASEHTHAPEPTVAEKPPSNAPTEKKVQYLAHRLREDHTIYEDEAAELPKAMLRNVVKDVYGFRRDTAKRYVSELIDVFGLSNHPDPDVDLLVTEPKRQTILDEQREQIDSDLDNL